ncbi:MAG: tRNA epoxyqueuosine(34) reductase QueG [Betaproteobacteria bacterium]
MSVSAADVKARARELGFDACGIAPAGDLPELGAFAQWLARGYAGEMAYLTRSADRRADVRAVLPSARSVIVTGTVYNVARPYSIECADPARARISRYAWGDDYHDVIGARLDALLDWLRTRVEQPFDARAYVDTGPVQERVYAQHAGIGWIGRNTCVIHPTLGSWLFLGEIITSLPLAPDEPAFDQCGTCTLCIDACPTRAIVAPGELDARRCISYLTIEQRGPIPDEWRAAVGSHVYGCDICQEVCPWNQHAARSDDPAWQPRPAWDGVTIDDLAGRSDEALAEGLRGTAMRRAKVGGMRRNIEVARTNAAAADARST